MGRTRRTGRVVAFLAGALWSTAAACQPGIAPGFAELDARFGAAFLTFEGRNTYALTAEGEDDDLVFTARAPASNRGDASRVTFWKLADSVSSDHVSCATWTNPTGDLYQPGAALRVRNAGGRVRAITVTQNVWYSAYWVFNVHVMDSAAPARFTSIGSFDLEDTFRPGGRLEPKPWRMCAGAVGDVVSFKVWPLWHREPAWDDPAYAGSVRLPAGWSEPGRPGWYVGHLQPGQSMQFEDLATEHIGSVVRGRTTPAGPEPTTPPRAPTDIARAP